jgi:metallo-beta-lactamase family protein
MQITFHGAARSVTGTRHLVEANGHRILLDCGLVQGRRDEAERANREYPFDPSSIDVVVLSHAHIDHSGALPALVKHGFHGQIHSTLATADLASYMLRDSAHIQEKDAEFANKRMARRGNRRPHREPLYTLQDAEDTLVRFAGHEYYRSFPVAPGITATFHDAGHILGSAIVRLDLVEDGRERSIVFSGDLGRPHLPIIRDPDRVEAADILIVESTYGDRTHEKLEAASERLASLVHLIAQRRGKLIIPAFAVGRTQEIVYELVHLLRERKIPDLPIYVDSPLAVNVTEVFRRHAECYDADIREVLAGAGDPFGMHKLHYLVDVQESMALNTTPGPCIIISASGMMEAGRVLHHLRNSIEDPQNAVLIVGFQAENTLGRRLLRGDKVVNIFGEPHPVRADVFVMNEYSAHADRDELLAWFHANPGTPREIFVVHGEEEQSQAFAERLRRESPARVSVPLPHESFGLGGRHREQRGVGLMEPWTPPRPIREKSLRGGLRAARARRDESKGRGAPPARKGGRRGARGR